MNIRNYLDRINVGEGVHVDYQSLRLIQFRHMLSVPFENLDIVTIRLDLKSIYSKVVVNRRGGYCYELNGLLHWALKILGFSVSMRSGQVLLDDGTYGPEFDHMALLVNIGQDYLVDVGLGDSVRSPVPVTGEIVSDVSGSYRISRGTDSNTLFFQKLTENAMGDEISVYITASFD